MKVVDVAVKKFIVLIAQIVKVVLRQTAKNLWTLAEKSINFIVQFVTRNVIFPGQIYARRSFTKAR